MSVFWVRAAVFRSGSLPVGLIITRGLSHCREMKTPAISMFDPLLLHRLSFHQVGKCANNVSPEACPGLLSAGFASGG